MVAVSKDAYQGVTTNISCVVTGISRDISVEWMLGNETQSQTYAGSLNTTSGTQTSALTVSNPQRDEIYTCVVISGQYPSSEASQTLVTLNTYSKRSHCYWN